ncbi:transmembrane 4 L6 family member 1-like [Hoplias malabaricus]|uniref:transmembrane 4 L6 family member 1-like n=1 Tax=Hoplias malabaricus TaxID=27720 RepID=UPI0034630140
MCTASCSRCIAISLYLLAFISIVCNIILFFPGWSVQYAMNGEIMKEVKLMGGLIGGGLMVLCPALFIHLTGKHGCCGNRCGMCVSILFALLGVAGALYSFVVALWGLLLCKAKHEYSHYLSVMTDTDWCTKMKHFNTALFSILLVTSVLEFLLCVTQMINGLFGCICGTCKNTGILSWHIYSANSPTFPFPLLSSK